MRRESPAARPLVLDQGSLEGLALSPAIAQMARQRLGALASILAGITLFGTLTPWVLFPSQSELVGRSVPVYMAQGGVALDAILMFLIWGTKWSDSRLLQIGFVYQVLRAATLSLSPLPEVGPPLLTWTALLVAVFPLLLPPVPIWTRAASLLSALTPPLSLWVILRFRPGSLDTVELVRPAVASFFSVLLALLSADVMRRFGLGASRHIGSYNLLERIGVGGMGEVWRAEHRFLSRPAAIKLIPRREKDTIRSQQKALRRFRREAQVTAHLTSPHTVQVFDYGITDAGVYYYVMEHLDGFDLQELVRRYGPLSSARTLFLLRQICDSIGEAHNAGLIHRDLKPSNLFVVRRGLRADFVKVLDFGLVGLGQPPRLDTFDGKITAAGMMTGTPAYTSPEMVMGAEVDPRADLYSLGCVLFYLVTGRLLFPGLGAAQMALAHAHEMPPKPSECTDRPVAPDLEHIILLLLEKDPAKRPQSAEQLNRLLDRIDVGKEWSDVMAEDWWNENKPVDNDFMREAVRRDSELSS